MSSSNFLSKKIYKKINKHYHQNDNAYFIFGKHSAIAALKNPKRIILEIYCTNGFLESEYDLVCQHHYNVIDNNFLYNLLGNESTHQGIAIKTLPSTTTIYDLNLNDHHKIAILDQISDPFNLGSIIRSAVAFNISTIIIPQHQSCQENSIVAKVAVGALEKINLIQVTNLVNTIKLLQKHNFWIIGLDVLGSQSITPSMLQNKIAVILGSENKGIRKLISQQCDFLVKIPISPSVESLNVGTAAAIIFYEIYKTN